MAKKRGSTVTEHHSAPRKFNPDIKRRVVVMLETALVVQLKTKAFESHVSVQRLVSDILTKHLEK